MFPIIIILVILLVVYMAGNQLGRTQKKKKRAMEIEVNVLLAQKEEIDALIEQADRDLTQKLTENQARASEDALKLKQALDEEINKIKSQKLAEVEQETADEKMAAVKSLHEWAEQEKARLQERFDEEYERKLEDLKKLK